MSLCKHCRTDINPKSLGRHVLVCTMNPKHSEYVAKRKKLKIPLVTIDKLCNCCGIQFIIIDTEKNILKKDKFFCSRSCANKRICNNETKEKISKSLTHAKEQKFCKTCNATVVNMRRKFCCDACRVVSTETRIKISTAVTGKTGGFRNFGGSGKKGIYQGLLFQSSWELAWLIYNYEHGKYPIRCDKIFSYTINDKVKKYYPDFELDRIIYEIKGFRSEKTSIKINSAKAAGYEIEVLYYDEIKHCLEYCKNKYGQKFYELYAGVA